MSWYGKCLRWKSGGGVDACRSDNMPGRSQRHLHGRQRVRHKLPVVFLQHCANRSGVPNRLRPFPAPTGAGVGGVPTPVEHCSIDALRWLGNIVLPSDRLWGGQYLNARLFFYFPRRIGVGYPRRVAFSVKKETGAIADSGPRSKHAKIPHLGGQDISPRTQERRDVIGLISPMTQIASRRAKAHALLIHIKNELIVRARVHDKVRRLLRKLNQLSKVQYRLVALWAVRGGDPLGAPHFFWRISGKLCLRNSSVEQPEYRNYEQAHRVSRSHPVLLLRRVNRILANFSTFDGAPGRKGSCYGNGRLWPVAGEIPDGQSPIRKLYRACPESTT